MAIKKINKKASSEPHRWRLCPAGQHWVVSHPLHINPSKANPEGKVTTRHGHCAKNPSGKDQLYPLEISVISQNHFHKIKPSPCPINLGFKKNGNSLDKTIAGWTKYWNEVLRPQIPMHPNVIKALIASESGFDSTMLANKKNSNSARGLMQILNSTRKTLGDEKGELQDHFLSVTKEELNDPNINICAGIRWLFQKQKLATAALGREATWEEAVMNYKGKLKSKTNDIEAKKQKKIFNQFLSRLDKCEN